MFRTLGLLLISISLPLTQANAAKASSAKNQLNKMTKQGIFDLPMIELEQLVGETLKDKCPFELDGEESPDSPQLNTVEVCAIHYYTTASFTFINKKLWLAKDDGTGLPGSDWGYIRVLDYALEKMKPAKPRKVYRGTKRDLIKFDQPGEIQCLKSYTSTSIKEDVATWFLDGQKNNERLMVIDAISARDVSSVSGAYEHEFLLPRGTCLRLERREIKEITVTPEETNLPERRKVEYVYLTEVRI